MTESREEFVTYKMPQSLTIKVMQTLDPASLWPLVDLALGSPRVLEALRHFRVQDSWDELYRAFEIVESEVGGEIHRAGWVTKADLDLFTRTANSMRHAKGTFQPPPKPMTLPEGVEFVRKTLKGWVEAKHQSSRVQGAGTSGAP